MRGAPLIVPSFRCWMRMCGLPLVPVLPSLQGTNIASAVPSSSASPARQPHCRRGKPFAWLSRTSRRSAAPWSLARMSSSVTTFPRTSASRRADLHLRLGAPSPRSSHLGLRSMTGEQQAGHCYTLLML